MYVDSLVQLAPLAAQERDRLVERILAGGSAIETVLRCAAQSVGVLTQELGVALGPRLDEIVLEHLDLVRLSADRLLMVLTLRGWGDAHDLRRGAGLDSPMRRSPKSPSCSTSGSPG